MILSVKGEFHNGVASPLTKIEGREGQQVIITFLEDSFSQPSPEVPTIVVNGSSNDLEGDPLMRLIAECATDTGIGDLAHEHDHYLYGTPKRGDYGK